MVAAMVAPARASRLFQHWPLLLALSVPAPRAFGLPATTVRGNVTGAVDRYSIKIHGSAALSSVAACFWSYSHCAWRPSSVAAHASGFGTPHHRFKHGVGRQPCY